MATSRLGTKTDRMRVVSKATRSFDAKPGALEANAATRDQCSRRPTWKFTGGGPSFSNISSYSMIFPLVKSHFADWNMGIFASSFTSLATIADYRYVSLPEGNHDQPWWKYMALFIGGDKHGIFQMDSKNPQHPKIFWDRTAERSKEIRKKARDKWCALV